jgi:DNA-binding NarL/FixJ family response regulator
MHILIVDNHTMFRRGLAQHISETVPKAKTETTENMKEALSLLAMQTPFDLVLYGVNAPESPWPEHVFHLQGARNRVAVVSSFAECVCPKAAFKAGCVGYIPKNSSAKVLQGALNMILGGGKYFSPHVKASEEEDALSMRRECLSRRLTERQVEVLGHLGHGYSNKQIAVRMSVSEATIKLHINALLRNLGAQNRTQAVILAQRNGLIGV